MPQFRNQDMAAEMVDSPDFRDKLAYCIEYDALYLWQNGFYRQLDQRATERMVWDFLKIKFPTINITRATVSDVLYQVKLSCHLQFDIEDDRYIAFADCLYDLEFGTTTAFDNNLLVTFHTPHSYNEVMKAECPQFQHFLETSLVRYDQVTKTYLTEEDLISQVQEMFGYCLMGHVEAQRASRAWFLVGSGANGKSVLLSALQNIFGPEYVSAMSIQTLTMDKFASQHLINKKINISNEEESKYLRSDKFKALITGDTIEAERKFGARFEFKPKTKFLFATNQLPTFSGINYGLVRRMQIIPFRRVFKPDERDLYLDQKIKAETPGVLRWALEGLRRLQASGYRYTFAKAAARALTEFESEVSSALRFMRENYVVNDAFFTPNTELYEHYRQWCERVGKKPVNNFTFMRDIQNIEGLRGVRGYSKALLSSVRGRNVKFSNDASELEFDDATIPDLTSPEPSAQLIPDDDEFIL